MLAYFSGSVIDSGGLTRSDHPDRQMVCRIVV
jgi:hypothetical protein